MSNPVYSKMTLKSGAFVETFHVGEGLGAVMFRRWTGMDGKEGATTVYKSKPVADSAGNYPMGVFGDVDTLDKAFELYAPHTNPESLRQRAQADANHGGGNAAGS